MEDLRKDYKLSTLAESSADPNPFKQFENWFNDAINSGTLEPNAFSLATVSEEGMPSSRMLLLKDYSHDGFIFYTDYTSKKGRELESNPKAAILFFWADLERQLRIQGNIKKVDDKISERYFASRPLDAQISASISKQSKKVKNRLELEKRWQDKKESSKNKVIQRPPNWGGYILSPDYFEFWQGRENRLHDRLSYYKKKKGWTIERLSP
jgi:pyridoxamine 5'-phosphate oxidase